MTPQTIQERIKQAFNTSFVLAESADNVHFYITVVAADFEDMTKIQQHKAIKSLFSEAFADESIHAMSLKTYTPEKWAEFKAKTNQ